MSYSITESKLHLAVVIYLIVFLAGCGTNPDKAYGPGSPFWNYLDHKHEKRADFSVAWKQYDFPALIALQKEEIEAGKIYYSESDQENDFFYKRGTTETLQSYASLSDLYLMVGDPEKAKLTNEEAFEFLSEAIQDASDVRASKAARKNTFANLVSVIGTAGSLYATFSGSSLDPQGIQNVTQNIAEHIETQAQREEFLSGIQSSLGSELSITNLPVRFPVMKTHLLTEKSSIFATIGRVRNGNSHCTGSIIGPNLVLTNAHCVTDDGRPSSTDSISFIVEAPYPTKYIPSDGDFSKITRPETRYDLTKFVTHRGVNSGWSKEFINDWAILVIGKPTRIRISENRIQNESDISKLIDDQKWRNYPFLSWNVAAQIDDTNIGDTGTLAMAGYSGDVLSGRIMTAEWGCSMLFKTKILSTEHFNFAHNCDSSPGSSGSPIFLIGNQERKYGLEGHVQTIVGLNHSKDQDATANSGLKFGVSPEAWSSAFEELKNEYKGLYADVKKIHDYLVGDSSWVSANFSDTGFNP